MRRIPSPAGFSLLEAIIAVGIFVASMAFIGQLLDVGIRLADQGKERTQALLRCESTLEEMVAGIRPIDPETKTGEQSDPLDRRWRTQVDCEETKVRGLWRVTVTCRFFEDPDASADDEPRLVESLTRLLVDRRAAPTATGRPLPTTEVTLPTLMGIGNPSGRR
jgi:type II secretory pathway pseudopilin PulG